MFRESEEFDRWRRPHGRDARATVAGVLLLILLLAGCHPLPPGPLDAVGRDPAGPRRGSVYLVRGWQDLWSEGIDRLGNELRAAGLQTQVYRESQWRELSDQLMARYRGRASDDPLVLIGFSYGADDVLRISERMKDAGIRPDLVITIDPVTPPLVPGNVQACYNYFQTNGVWDVFPWLRGIPLRASVPGQLVNVDIRRDRPDLIEPNMSHATIAGNEKLHREIIQRVLAVCPIRELVDKTDSPRSREDAKEEGKLRERIGRSEPALRSTHQVYVPHLCPVGG
jgi:hypothetical protein